MLRDWMQPVMLGPAATGANVRPSYWTMPVRWIRGTTNTGMTVLINLDRVVDIVEQANGDVIVSYDGRSGPGMGEAGTGRCLRSPSFETLSRLLAGDMDWDELYARMDAEPWPGREGEA